MSDTGLNALQPMWQPSAARMQQSLMQHYMESLQQQGLNLTSYAQLYQWSIDESPAFWASIWDFFGVVSQHRGSHILKDKTQMPGAQWFPDAHET